MCSLRFIVTQHHGGPGLFAVLDYIGFEQVLNRVQTGMAALNRHQ